MNPSNALGRESLPSILGVKHLRAERPDSQIVVWVDAHLAVIGGPRIRIAHFLPSLALIIAAKDSTLFVLHQRIDDVRILAVNIQADAAGFSAIFVGQPF